MKLDLKEGTYSFGNEFRGHKFKSNQEGSVQDLPSDMVTKGADLGQKLFLWVLPWFILNRDPVLVR